MAYRMVKEVGVRRLPVLEDGDVAGIVTVDDLLVALVLELGAAVSPLAREITHPDSAFFRGTTTDGEQVAAR